MGGSNSGRRATGCKMTRVWARLLPADMERLRQLADSEHLPVSALVRRILIQSLAGHGKNAESRNG